MNANLQRRVESLEARRPGEPVSINRLIVDGALQVTAAMCRPGSDLIDREPGESEAALLARAGGAR